jgi:hypothetical protein
MPASTPLYGLPYPTGTDRVMDGDNAIGALADAVESLVHGSTSPLVPIFQRSSAPFTVPLTTEAGIPSTLVTLPTVPAGLGYTAAIWAQWDVNITGAGVGAVTTAIWLDGTSRGGGPSWATAGTGRQTLTGFVIAALTPGAHTIQLAARKTINAGAATIESAGLGVGSTSATHVLIVRFPLQPGALMARLGDVAGAMPAEGAPRE